MNRRTFLAAAALPGLVLGRPALAGPAPIRIGWLTAQREASLTPYVAALRQSLSDLGYEEGRNLILERRYGNDDNAAVPDLARELVRSGVRLILAQGGAVSIVKSLDLPVPVIFVTSGDPVTAGLADSLARPRGNMTGITFMAPDLNGKRLDLMRELVPDLKRIVLLGNPEHPGQQLEQAVSEDFGKRFGMEVTFLATRRGEDLAGAYAAMAAHPPQALSIFADGFALENRGAIIEFATRHRIPVTSGWAAFARSGAVLTYGPRLIESYRRLASYVDRVLKGARPADLPIEQPTVFELIINLRAAEKLGLRVPPTLLVRADEVLE